MANKRKPAEKEKQQVIPLLPKSHRMRLTALHSACIRRYERILRVRTGKGRGESGKNIPQKVDHLPAAGAKVDRLSALARVNSAQMRQNAHSVLKKRPYAAILYASS